MQHLHIAAAVAAICYQEHLGRFSRIRDADGHITLVALGFGNNHFPAFRLIGIQGVCDTGRHYDLIRSALGLAGSHVLEHGIVHNNLELYGNGSLGQFQHRIIGKSNHNYVRLGSIYGHNRTHHFCHGVSHICPVSVSNLRIPFAIFHLELSHRCIFAVLSVGAIGTDLLTVHQQPLAVKSPVVVSVGIFPHTYGRSCAILTVFSAEYGLFYGFAVLINKDKLISGTVWQFRSILDKVFPIDKILDKAHLGVEFLNLFFHLGQTLF